MPHSIHSAASRTVVVAGSPPELQIDTSAYIEDNQAWPARKSDRVSFSRFVTSTPIRPAGLRLLAGDDVRRLAGKLDGVPSIELYFVAFTDGRSYSQAKLLRERLGFQGELRVAGDVGIDQVHYLREVGCTIFDLRPGTDLEKALAALSHITVNYRDPSTRRA